MNIYIDAGHIRSSAAATPGHDADLIERKASIFVDG